jgi:hypothetical protein
VIHPDTELRFISEDIGYGVVAMRLIPRGTITWVRDRLDQAFSLEEVQALPDAYREIVAKYFFVDGHGDFILCWDHARYVNHSCDAVCRSAGYDFEVAVRDVHPGEELTDDYGSLNLEYDFACSCGSPQCRRIIRPDDLLRYADEWDRLVEAPFRAIPTVAQPLWPFLEERVEVEAALAGDAPIASVRKNFVDLEALAARRPPDR